MMNEYSVLVQIFSSLAGNPTMLLLAIVLIGGGILFYKFATILLTYLKDLSESQTETKEHVIKLGEQMDRQEEITDLKLSEISRRIQRLEDNKK